MAEKTDWMPRTKIEGFFKEFDWLSECVKKYDIHYDPLSDFVSHIYVMRIESKHLDQKFLGSGSDREYEGYYHVDQAQILDENGGYIGEIGKVKIPEDKNRSWWEFWKRERFQDLSRNGETLLKAIDRLSANAHFLVVVRMYGYRTNDLGQLRFDRLQIHIYKSPKDYNFMTWVEHGRQYDRDEIKKEVGALDRV